MTTRAPKGRWQALAFALRRNIVAVTASLLIIAILVGSAATLIRSPGIQFSFEVKTVGATLRLGSRGAVLQDIGARTIAVEADSGASPARRNNNVLDETASADAAVPVTGNEIDSIIAPGGSLVDISHTRRSGDLAIIVEGPEGAVVEAMIGQEDPSQADGAATIGAKTVKGRTLSFRLVDPQSAFDASPLFPITDLRMENVNSQIADAFPVSLVSEAEITFIAFGYPLEKRILGAGQTLRFENLAAEVSALSFGHDGIVLRMFGRADDVKAGFGSAFVSIFPSAYEGLAASPIVRLILSTFMALILTIVGGASLFKDGEKS